MVSGTIELPVWLVGAIGNVERKILGIAVQPTAKLHGYGDVHDRGAQTLPQTVHLLNIELDCSAARQRQRGFRRFRRHVRIAVAITTNPGTELQHARQIMRLD